MTILDLRKNVMCDSRIQTSLFIVYVLYLCPCIIKTLQIFISSSNLWSVLLFSVATLLQMDD